MQTPEPRRPLSAAEEALVAEFARELAGGVDTPARLPEVRLAWWARRLRAMPPSEATSIGLAALAELYAERARNGGRR